MENPYIRNSGDFGEASAGISNSYEGSGSKIGLFVSKSGEGVTLDMAEDEYVLFGRPLRLQEVNALAYPVTGLIPPKQDSVSIRRSVRAANPPVRVI